jgi:hypothetical protein
LFDVLRNTNYLKSEYKRKYDGNVLLNSKQVGKLSYYKKKLLDIDDRIKLVLNKFIDGKLTGETSEVITDMHAYVLVLNQNLEYKKQYLDCKFYGNKFVISLSQDAKSILFMSVKQLLSVTLINSKVNNFHSVIFNKSN